ncbi:MAG: hypothetical protein RSA91_08020, partial [Bacilli bacterium]
YNKIIEWANKLTGNSKESLFIKDLKNKWESAYRNDNTIRNNNDVKHSIQTDKKGNKFINVDTDQDLFNELQQKDYNKIAKMYINEYFRGTTELSSRDSVIIDSKSANKYSNPGM